MTVKGRDYGRVSVDKGRVTGGNWKVLRMQTTAPSVGQTQFYFLAKNVLPTQQNN